MGAARPHPERKTRAQDGGIVFYPDATLGRLGGDGVHNLDLRLAVIL
jgi:hypothetical protein